jgi:cell division protein FtsB
MSWVTRVVWGALGAGVAAFAVQGGEYGTTDLLGQRTRRARVEREIGELERQVDSLRLLDRRLRSDPVLQERVAREEFGMVRGERELLYRFIEPEPTADAVNRGARTRAPSGGG